MIQSNQSEVARLKAQIAAEVESAQRAINGFAYGVAKHSFITKRMERMGDCHEQLRDIVGDKEAAQILFTAMERIEPQSRP